MTCWYAPPGRLHLQPTGHGEPRRVGLAPYTLCYGPAVVDFQTARLLLRRWFDDDLERLVALFSDPCVARFLSVDGRPWTRERTVGVFEHFRRQWREHDFGPWAAIDKQTGRWLGQIGLNELPSWPGPYKVEVGWELDPSVWGRGLATEGAGPRCDTVSRSSGWSGSSAWLGPTMWRPGE
jgi:RimJ/RimL family protein N-acetyltransferase